MAGGLFPGHPFSLNIKCIIFTAILAAGYWYAPHKNLWVLAFLIWFPYIALAWYDYSYDCCDKLKPTLVPFGRYVWLPFKPPGYKDEFNKMPPDQIEAMNKLDHITLWTIIAAATAYFLVKKQMNAPAPGPVSVPEKKMSTAMDAGIGVGMTLSAACVLLCGIKFGNWIQTNQVTPIQETAAKLFENFALLGKGGLILLLVVLALLNGNVSYVAKNPNKFMQDAVATGGFGALAAVFLTLTRGRPDLMLNHFVFALLLFFLYHVCREFAGYFTIFGSEQMTSKEKAEENKLSKPLLIVGSIALVIALGLAFTAREAPDMSRGIFQSLSPSFAFALETIIFVAIITGGEVLVARNHKDPIGTAVGTSALLFTFAHLVLQGGGFYGHLYRHPKIE